VGYVLRMARAAVVATVVHITPRPMIAQMAGSPVLQSAFSNPGITLGANLATGDDANTYGLAGAWAPASGTVQLSGGIGLLHPDSGSDRATWGVRAMAPIPKLGTRSIGVAAFVGVGGARLRGRSETRIPLGVSVAYRRAIGTRRAVFVYLAPLYSWSRFRQDTVTVRRGVFRVSVGVDVVVIPQVGLTLGYEGGSRARPGEPGPAGSLFGVGISYALHRAP
jgi:hypothetical protein